MKRLFHFVLLCALMGGAPAVQAQEPPVWVQIEAVRTLDLARERAQAYGAALPNVAGFTAPGGWFALVLGPHTPASAQAELQALRGDGLIPRDSYVVRSGQYREQFWPPGASTLGVPFVTNDTAPSETALAPSPPVVPLTPVDETPREARASERRMLAQERQDLQDALQWEGFYTGKIDGAFGPGTRAAMAGWQAAQGFEATGVLTTRQRAQLVQGYRDTFDALGLAAMRDDAAGIELILPAQKVTRARTEAPFVHYDSTDSDEIRVVLISQSGDEATLFGLYDIMQTLEIVPLSGQRERKRQSFVLTGQSEDLHSYTYAELRNGAVKGFTVAWPPEQAKVMERVVQMMRESFTPVAGVVLPDTAHSDDAESQRIDLLAGLEIRRPGRSRSGVFVDGAGSVLTTTDVLGQCDRLTIGEEADAEIAAQDAALGLALLRPREPLAPMAVAEFRPDVPRLNSEIALAGYSYEDVLSMPVMTYGTLAELRGLEGEDHLDRVTLTSLPGDAGGPVFDATGAVLGILRAREDSVRRLPPDVNFAVDVAAIAGFLDTAGLTPSASERTAPLAPEDLTMLAADLTVRVSCWN